MRTQTELQEITFLTDETGLASCVKHVFDDNAEKAELPSSGSLTFVVVKQGADWRIALAQTTPILT
jgi:hypothetical protein